MSKFVKMCIAEWQLLAPNHTLFLLFAMLELFKNSLLKKYSANQFLKSFGTIKNVWLGGKS